MKFKPLVLFLLSISFACETTTNFNATSKTPVFTNLASIQPFNGILDLNFYNELHRNDSLSAISDSLTKTVINGIKDSLGIKSEIQIHDTTIIKRVRTEITTLINSAKYSIRKMLL